MTHPGSFAIPAAVPAQATFGRDGAMFESLLGFVAQLSLVLWSVVTLTVVIRFIGIRFYRRAARRALARIAAANASAPGPAGAATGSGTDVFGPKEAAAKPSAKPAVPPVVLPAIAVVPVIRAGLDLLQPANVPLPEAVTNVLASQSVDG
ncbi:MULTISPECIES: hypothetical protein [Micrococcaceae]|uniref:Uncharacterized protein n=1 Tax=Arthrobacter sedimenti TaxID=2694931 RepID=A0ABV8WIK5_9MICC|nr:hypothetical protein [Pseudarthrobacter defluvii]WJH23586.1 hypothetical protein JCQ34_14135 [Pseudarthrobacter defluvii]